MNHKFPPIIAGEFITLSKVQLEDADFIYGLRTSPAAEFLNRPEGYSIETQINWQTNRPDDEANYIIYNQAEHRAARVGMVSIYECDWANGVSNVGRLLLKEQYVHKGTPYGLEALQLTYNYVFNVMNFRKISGIINSCNERIYKLQRHLGMVQEGYFRQHVMLNGQPQDLYFLSLFKEDFPAYYAKLDLLLSRFRP